ncbi:glycoside hydrolase family 36 protein [Oerskovia flava]|uniref:glycoside hydrolase family 36 protein n=1 Tax=Oerskovia flava TaxID=2986422 RepID=UPI002240CFC3|nr:glycoside hydrolase family 36 protein [Oerskovia sp. JB1-3-2]
MILEELAAHLDVTYPGPAWLSTFGVVHAEVVDAGTDGDLDLLHLKRTPTSDDGWSVVLEVPLGDAIAYWNPRGSGERPQLPADWSGSDATSFVSSAPMGCLYDAAGGTLLAFAADEVVHEVNLRFGVWEEGRSFVVRIDLPSGSDEVTLALARPGRPFHESVAQLSGWVRSRRGSSLAVPAAAVEPVFSTWYAFGQDLAAEAVEQEALEAVALGCRSVFVDDGWQELGDGRLYAGVGDWVPDERKFPDLAGHVGTLHDAGMSVVLWIAPLLLGARSRAHARLADLAPAFAERLQCRVLDPRLRAVREHVVDTCVHLVTHYRLDGLKIDFIDEAMTYAGTPAPEDVGDVGVAVDLLLTALSERLAAAGRPETVIEFRQPYAGPGIAVHSNAIRAADCPADAIANRCSIADLRMSEGAAAVHSDMMMWDPQASTRSVARQLYGGFFAVPQLSMRLADLSVDHRAVVRAFLSRWRSVRDVVLHGRFVPGAPEARFPVLRAELDGRVVVGVYQDVVVPVPARFTELTLFNATAAPGLVLRPEDGGSRFVRVRVVDERGHLLAERREQWDTALVALDVPSSAIVQVTPSRS